MLDAFGVRWRCIVLKGTNLGRLRSRSTVAWPNESRINIVHSQASNAHLGAIREPQCASRRRICSSTYKWTRKQT